MVERVGLSADEKDDSAVSQCDSFDGSCTSKNEQSGFSWTGQHSNYSN